MSKLDACLRLFSGLEKSSAMLPEVIPQEHQQRVADRLSGEDPRLMVYHGLGTGKSLASILAAESAKDEFGDDYGIVAPASLRPNFQKEIQKFTTDSDPEIMSYTGLGLGKKFKKQPQTLIVDEAHRLRNPMSASSKAIAQNAAAAKRLMLLSGSPIVNEPSDLAAPISLLTGNHMTPKQFEDRFVGKEQVKPGLIARLRGVTPGERYTIKNENELRDILRGHVDYQPGKTPEGVNVNEEVIKTPMTAEQERIQNAIRKGLPLKFLWKLDSEFPLSAEESKKLNAFLSGLRQVSLSTQAFRADKNPLKAFHQSGKLTKAFGNLKELLAEDERKKALIYSNYVNAGIDPYAAALASENIPHGVFHGGIPEDTRSKAIKDYNEGRLRALLIGPAGAEGISTKGTNLIQLLDPHWNETRSSQAKGRGLRFDSHADLPEELKDVKVQRYISTAPELSLLQKLTGKKPVRTGDEIVQSLAKNKEQLNERFRKILQEEGTPDE
jgi:SNF2 family DNA or RNA helicase